MITNVDRDLLMAGLDMAHQAVILSIADVKETEIRLEPAPGGWTVAQLLAHITEIQYFWMEKAVLITQEDDPNITRSDVENDRRSAAITDHSEDSLKNLKRDLVKANKSAIATFRKITLEDLNASGHRGEDNPITVAGVIQYLASHMNEHASQINQSLGKIRLNQLL